MIDGGIGQFGYHPRSVAVVIVVTIIISNIWDAIVNMTTVKRSIFVFLVLWRAIFWFWRTLVGSFVFRTTIRLRERLCDRSPWCSSDGVDLEDDDVSFVLSHYFFNSILKSYIYTIWIIFIVHVESYLISWASPRMANWTNSAKLMTASSW